MILKTYLRVFTEDLDRSLQLFRELTGREVDMRFPMPTMSLEVAAIGDICLLGGSPEALAPLRSIQGPLIVKDLDAVKNAITRDGGEIIRAEEISPSGRYLWARHKDGTMVEYVQWNPELVDLLITNVQQAVGRSL
jgi:predicted enzyme related to lactoylglutathione lyase